MTGLRRDPQRWVQFMMRFELGLEAPKPGRAGRSARTSGGAYFIGGLVPLIPYLMTSNIEPAFWASAGVTLLSLLAFGGVKGRLTGMPVLRSALHTAIIGGLAATVAYGVARLANGL
jgi:VIT1/CCC1 family predicted Fe2+/Mn2+ transporter